MPLNPQRFADHLRAAYGAEQSVIVKGDGYYDGAIRSLTALERTTMIRELRDCGFSAEFVHGALGGESLRIRCIDGAMGKSLVESMNAVEERTQAPIDQAKKGKR